MHPRQCGKFQQEKLNLNAVQNEMMYEVGGVLVCNKSYPSEMLGHSFGPLGGRRYGGFNTFHSAWHVEYIACAIVDLLKR